MANIYDMADTWNAGATTFTAIKMNVTDTASAAASLLMDLQVGGSSKFSVNKSGGIRSALGYSTSNVLLGPADNTGFTWSGSTAFHIASGVANFGIDANGMKVNGDKSIGFSAAGVDAGDSDLRLYRDAAGTLAQRNSTTAQSSNIYFSYTDASNYTRLALKTATGIHTLETESAGTGEANIDLALTPKGTGRVRFGTHAAIGAETVTGYITIKDSGGTERKVAVVS